MPVKLTIKLLWICNIVLTLATILVVLFVFSNYDTADAIELPNITPRGKKIQNDDRPLEYYSYIWEENINIKAPSTPRITTPKDWHRQLLQRSLKIKQIVCNGFAIVEINRKTKLIESLSEANKNDRTKPWEVYLGGNAITVTEIILGKGITFKFQSGKEVFIKHTSPDVADLKNSDKPIRKVMENHWIVTAKEGTRILRKSDKHIEQLAPVVAYNDYRKAIGIKLRRIPENSTAYTLGLRKNDIVNNINGTPLKSLNPQDIHRIIKKHHKAPRIVVTITRNNRKEKLTFEVRR